MTSSIMKDFHQMLDQTLSDMPEVSKAAVLKELAISDCLQYEHLIIVCNDGDGDEVIGSTHMFLNDVRIMEMRISEHATLQYTNTKICFHCCELR